MPKHCMPTDNPAPGGDPSGIAPGLVGQEQGWAAFDALPQPCLNPSPAALAPSHAPAQATAEPSPPAAAAPPPGAGGYSGWQAFESDAPLLPVPAATVVVPDAQAPPVAARGSLIMKELPSVSALAPAPCVGARFTLTHPSICRQICGGHPG